MNTTYDQIFTSFLENCRPDTRNLPYDDMGKYAMIKNAVDHYNNRMDEDELICDDVTETVNKQLNGSRLLILAYCLKYIYENNRLSEFLEVYSMFQKEIGFKDYKDQLKGKQDIIDRTDNKITELITNIEEKSIL